MQVKCSCSAMRIGGVNVDVNPEKDCPHCAGSGIEDLILNSQEFEALWTGKCSQCGRIAGFRVQYSGMPGPLDDEHQVKAQVCLNLRCKGQRVEWVKTLIVTM